MNKEQRAAYNKAYYEENSKKINEKRNERERRRYKANPEKQLIKQKALRDANPEKYKASYRKWHDSNKDKARFNCRNYRKNNPEKSRLQSKNNHKKMCESISDVYICRLLNLKKEQLTTELIELKKVHIKIIREIRSQKQ